MADAIESVGADPVRLGYAPTTLLPPDRPATFTIVRRMGFALAMVGVALLLLLFVGYAIHGWVVRENLGISMWLIVPSGILGLVVLMMGSLEMLMQVRALVGVQR